MNRRFIPFRNSFAPKVMPVFHSLTIGQRLRLASAENVSPDLVTTEVYFDDDNTGDDIDPYGDIRSSRMDKAMAALRECEQRYDAQKVNQAFTAKHPQSGGTPAPEPAPAPPAPAPEPQ